MHNDEIVAFQGQVASRGDMAKATGTAPRQEAAAPLQLDVFESPQRSSVRVDGSHFVHDSPEIKIKTVFSSCQEDMASISRKQRKHTARGSCVIIIIYSYSHCDRL